MMKRMMSLILALAMLLSASAMAEDSTKYTLSLINPVFSYTDYEGTETSLDLTGLELALSTLLADSGVMGVMAELYSGPDSEFLTSLLLQLDENGLAFRLGDMSSCYDVPVEDNADIMLYHMLGLLGGRSILNNPELTASVPAADFGPEFRITLIESMFGPYVTASETTGETMVHQFTISREQGGEILESAIDALDEIGDVDMEDDISFDLTGTLTAVGAPSDGAASWTLAAEGHLYDDDTDQSVPLTLNYTDDMQTVTAEIVTGPEDESVTFRLNSASTDTADGRSAAEADIVVLIEGETLLSVKFTAVPGAGRQTDYLVYMTMPETAPDEFVSLSWSTDYTPTIPDGEGFRMEFSTNTEGSDTFFGFAYEGQVLTHDVYGDYRTGTFTLNIRAEGEVVDFGTEILLMMQDMPSESWTFDGSAPVDIENMDDNESMMLMLGAMGIIGNVVPKLQEDVPGLAPYLDSLLGDMLG